MVFPGAWNEMKTLFYTYILETAVQLRGTLLVCISKDLREGLPGRIT